MLRGTLVLFAGMFTMLLLRRRLFIHHWMGMVLIMVRSLLGGKGVSRLGERESVAWGKGAQTVCAQRAGEAGV